MINVFNKLILKMKLKKAGYPIIKVHKDTIKKYRESTNKNKDKSNFEIIYKLSREYYSGWLASINDDSFDTTYYGYLKIVKDNKRNMITDIHNSKQNKSGRINYEVKNEINKIYTSVFGGEV